MRPHPIVMVVEDDSSVAEVMVELLGLRGITTVRAGNGQMAMALAHLHQPSLVILDWGIDGTPSGGLLVRQLRLMRPSPAVIVCSGDPHAAALSAHAGASDYLAKPFAIEDFYALIDEYT